MATLSEMQADIMLALSAICGVIVLLVHLTDSMSRKQKLILMPLELSAMFLLIADRRAYIFRGDTSEFGWWMVRISNFMVFFLTLVVIFFFNKYLIQLLIHEGKVERKVRRLEIAKYLILAGMAMVIISQFTGFYYTFDEFNRYQRAPGFIVCYLFPFAALLLQLSVIIQYHSRLRRSIGISLLLFTGLSVAASIAQLFMYGISLNNITIVTMAALLYVFALQDLNKEVGEARRKEIEYYREEQKKEHALFEQTAEALASAIDAKDPYTKGHSTRVAMYAAQIAREAHKPEEECEKVYFAGLLHDVGKIGIPSAVINKPGRLTDEEYALIKMHPVFGNQILSSIQQSPYLSIGAHYHHERYDGKGYPEGLKGDDIPDIARMIAVADSYDAMTSKRSYRDPIPQQKVREELVKGIGTQFDPEYAKIMIHMIDLDIEYTMREREAGTDDAVASQLRCERIYKECSVGIPVTEFMTRIRLSSRPDEGFDAEESLPTLILFDSLDERIHEEEDKKKDLLYLEYGRIRLDGKTEGSGTRNTLVRELPAEDKAGGEEGKHFAHYTVEALREKDHVMIRVHGPRKSFEYIAALPHASLFSYLSITGEHCTIANISVSRDETAAEEGCIPRIAEEISYIKGCPEGDIPNVQIDGWRSETTKGVPVADAMEIAFHTRSLPTARLVWHCPFISLYTSEDGSADGDGYREYLLLRLDGENWESDAHATNEVYIDHTRDFPGWNAWKEANRQGMDCRVKVWRDGNRVMMETDNLGIAIDSVTTIVNDTGEIYLAMTGDQCTLTDIRIRSLAEKPAARNG